MACYNENRIYYKLDNHSLQSNYIFICSFLDIIAIIAWRLLFGTCTCISTVYITAQLPVCYSQSTLYTTVACLPLVQYNLNYDFTSFTKRHVRPTDLAKDFMYVLIVVKIKLQLSLGLFSVLWLLFTFLFISSCFDGKQWNFSNIGLTKFLHDFNFLKILYCFHIFALFPHSISIGA